MGVNALNSSNDPICPTYASGTWAIMSGNAIPDRLTDSTLPGGVNGLQNQFQSFTVNSFNSDWNNDCLDQKVAVTYSSSGLLSFGNTGRQS